MTAIGRFTWPALPGASLTATAEAARVAGFAHIEPVPDLTGTDSPDSTRAGCADRLRAAQAILPVPALAALTDLVSGDDSLRAARVAAISRAIWLAADCGVPVVTVYAGPDTWDPAAPMIPRDLPFGVAWGRFSTAFDTLLTIAAEHGVRLAFKPVLGTLAHDAGSTLRVLAAWRGHPAFALTFDPSHFAVHGDDLGQVIADWGPLLANVHLKDGFGRPGVEGVDFHFPPVGTGQVDWGRVASALTAARYRGPMSLLDESALAARQDAAGVMALAQRARGDIGGLLGEMAVAGGTGSHGPEAGAAAPAQADR